MANMKPFFLTGANARILLNNKTVAFATDVNYRVTVKHAAPRVLGRAEVETLQPLAYDVSGSLTIIRYGRGLQGHFGSSAPMSVNNKGDGIGSFGPSSPVDTAAAALGLPSTTGNFDGAANENFDPSRFFQSKMFNIEIRQVGLSGAGTGNNQFATEPPKNGRGRDIPAGTAIGKALKKIAQINTKSEDEVPVVLLRDCRFEDLNFTLSKRGVATITMTFRARYADDDTMIARKSGAGQEFS